MGVNNEPEPTVLIYNKFEMLIVAWRFHTDEVRRRRIEGDRETFEHPDSLDIDKESRFPLLARDFLLELRLLGG